MVQWTDRTEFDFLILDDFVDPCLIDDQNGVDFRTDLCGDAFGATTLAVTFSLFFPQGGMLLETDIVFNDLFEWDVYSGPNRFDTVDFSRVAVHELGHAVGLGHENNVPAIMASVVGDIESPQLDDISGVSTIYAAGSPPLPVTNCPGPLDMPVNSTASGVLMSSDCALVELLPIGPASNFTDQYRVTVPSNGNLSVRMTSSAIDALLILTDTGLSAIIDVDDNSASGTNALMARDLPPGTYVILATSSAPGQSGSYTLSTTFSLSNARPVSPSEAPADGIKFLGGMSASGNLPSATATEVLTVPSGVNFLLTDLILSNVGTSVGCVRIYTGPGEGTLRSSDILVPDGESTTINFRTGIGFVSDDIVTLRNCGNVDLAFTLRGYKFTIN